MQSVVIENQILNMLGIFAVMPQAFQTTTLPDSPNVVQERLRAADAVPRQGRGPV